MGMGSGVDQSRLNSSSPSSPGGKGGGSSSPQQASSQPSSPGGKGGGGGYSPGAEPSPAYGGGAPTSPGGKGGGPSTFNSFPDPSMGRGASPGGKGGGGYGPDDRFMPQQQYQQPFQQQFGQPGIGLPPHEQGLGGRGGLQQPQRPAFLDNPEYQGYQKQAQDLNNQLNDYTKQSPIFQQLQDLQGKLRGFESPQQQQTSLPPGAMVALSREEAQRLNQAQQTQQSPNAGYGEVRAAVMPQEGTPEYLERYGTTMPVEGKVTPFTGDQAREAEARGQQQREEYQNMSQAERMRVALDDSGMGRGGYQQRMLENNRRVMQQTPQERQRIQQELMVNPLNGNQQPGFNPARYEYNPNMQKPYMPQRQMTPEQQRMQNIMGLYTPDHYQQLQQQQQRGMTMDMPQQYGGQQQLPQYGQSGLGISQLSNMANMLRGNPMQQMQRQNTYQNPYQSQLQAAQQFNMQRANMANQQQRQLAQQYQRQQSQMSARKALEQAQGQYDFGSGAG